MCPKPKFIEPQHQAEGCHSPAAALRNLRTVQRIQWASHRATAHAKQVNVCQHSRALRQEQPAVRSIGDEAQNVSGHDHYRVAGQLSFGGSLQVVWWGGFAGQAGQRFDLCDWGSSEGRFDTIDLSGAPLADGLGWDTSLLYGSGELLITAVPEPSTWALLLAGLGWLQLRSRRAIT